MGERIKFTVGRYNPNRSAIDFVSSKRESRNHFPAPQKPFNLMIDGQTYTTSIQNVKNGRTIIAKTYDSNGLQVIRHDLCVKHNIKEGAHIFIEVIVPFRTHLLIK